jgi:hypothetical protein
LATIALGWLRVWAATWKVSRVVVRRWAEWGPEAVGQAAVGQAAVGLVPREWDLELPPRLLDRVPALVLARG